METMIPLPISREALAAFCQKWKIRSLYVFRLVHAYHRVSEERVWTIAESEVPALLAFIDSVLPEFDE